MPTIAIANIRFLPIQMVSLKPTTSNPKCYFTFATETAKTGSYRGRMSADFILQSILTPPQARKLEPMKRRMEGKQELQLENCN
jgi:hypothetical protein